MNHADFFNQLQLYLLKRTILHSNDLLRVVDYQRELTTLKIDGSPIPTLFSRTTKVGWDTNIAARLQAEIISIDDNSRNIEAMHKAEFKDWYWYWEPAKSCQTYLPMLANPDS